MYYLLVILGVIIFSIKIKFFMGKPFFNLATSAVKQLDIILDRSISEKDKDKLLLKNLFQLLFYFSINLALFISLLMIGMAPILLYIFFYPYQAIDYNSLYFYASLSLGSLIIFIQQKRSDYSYWSRLLHTVILDNYNLAKFFLKLELRRNQETNVDNNKPYVLVTGLARAGTTALVNLLYDDDIFHSIKYSNLPFLMAPRFWSKIYNPRQTKEKERAHKDGLSFHENSIEAFEEYFFKIFLNDDYIHRKYLIKHNISDKVYRYYLSYQALFKNKDTIYLAKNNNLALRFKSLRKLDNQFKVILIFRNPIEHAISLMKQHKHYTVLQSKNKFTLNYMNWLGHHEFGLNHKRFHLSKNKIDSKFNTNSLNYWLELWINYHNYIMKFINDENLCLVHQSDLLYNPVELKNVLSVFLSINLKISQNSSILPQRSNIDNHNIDSKLIYQANELYQSLLNHRLRT